MQEVRTCSVQPSNAEGVCGGAASAGFAACLVAPGEVACPSGSPFTNRTVIGDTETLVCSACTNCVVQGTCVSPSVKFFSDYLCNNTFYVGTLAADGNCTKPGWAGQSVNSIEYQAQVNASCSSSGSSAAFQTTGAQTLCCR